MRAYGFNPSVIGCARVLLFLSLLGDPEQGLGLAIAVPPVPTGTRIELATRWSKTTDLYWDYAPRVITWEVLKNCSTDPALVTTIRVAEPSLVDDRVAFRERCTYRVLACDLDGCSPPAAAVHAVFGSVPGAPSAVIAVRPSLPNTLTVRYLPPADSGAGDAATVALTNFKVELSRDPSFSRVDAAAESGDGAVWVQSLRVLKGESYFCRVSAANAMGFGPPTYYAGANGTLAPQLPPLDPAVGAHSPPTDPRGERTPSPCAGAPNGNGSLPCVAVRVVGQPASPVYVTAAPAPGEALGDGEATVRNLALRVEWQAPVDTGCWDSTEALHAYLVEADESPDFDSAATPVEVDDHVEGPPTRVSAELPAGAAAVELGPLRRGARYYVRVRAANVVGYGEPRAVGARAPVAVGTLTAPDPPTVLGGWPSAEGEISWAFARPADDGGSALLGFRAEVATSPDFLAVLHARTEFVPARLPERPPQPAVGGEAGAARRGEAALDWGGAMWASEAARARLGAGAVLVARFGGLDPGTYYHFRVQARGAGGWSKAGVAGHPLPEEAPAAPDGGLALLGGSLAWGEHLESLAPARNLSDADYADTSSEDEDDDAGNATGRWPVAARAGGRSQAGVLEGGRWGDYLESAVLPCGVGVLGDVRGCGTAAVGGAGLAASLRGLRAFYRFDAREGLGVDSSGDAMHARVVGNITRGRGRVGYGAVFPGAADGDDAPGAYLEVPNLLRLCFAEECVRLDGGARGNCTPPSCLPALPSAEAGPLGEAGTGTAEGGASLGANAGFRSWAVSLWFSTDDPGPAQVLFAMFGRRWGEQPRGEDAPYAASGGAEGGAALPELARANLALWVKEGRLVLVVMGVRFDLQGACGDLDAGFGDALACAPAARAPFEAGRAYLLTLSFSRAARALALYLDDGLYATVAAPPLLDPRSGHMTVGGCNCSLGALGPGALTLAGSLDSVRIYDRALPGPGGPEGAGAAEPLEARALPAAPPGHARAGTSVGELWAAAHAEQPFPVQALRVPSAPSMITSVRAWEPGDLWVQFAVPWDHGDGLCRLEQLPACDSAYAAIEGKCQQGQLLPCPAVVRYRLEMDDHPDFLHLDFVQEYDAPALVPPPGETGGGPARPYAVPVESVEPASEPQPSEGYGAEPTGDRTELRVHVSGLPLGRRLYIRVFAANAVGWGPPQTLSVKDGVPTSVRLSGPFFMERNAQGVYQYQSDESHDPRHYGEL